MVGLTTVTLHRTQGDALSGVNTVGLNNYGIGKQTLQSYYQKSVVDSVNVLTGGSGYENKKRTSGISGISTSLDEITISKHDYKSGEVINSLPIISFCKFPPDKNWLFNSTLSVFTEKSERIF